MTATRRLIQETKVGKLEVEMYDDQLYPGFTLLWNGKQVGVFEYNSTADAAQIAIWRDSQEDPTVMYHIDPPDAVEVTK